MQPLSSYLWFFSQNYYRTNNPEIYMEQQKINSCQSNCEEKNKTGGITLMDSSYKATVIKHSLAQKQT